MLNSQELLGDELEMFAKKEAQKDVVVPKKAGEPLGIVVVESGWGSMLPTVVIANLQPNGAASRCNQLNIGDQVLLFAYIIANFCIKCSEPPQFKAERKL